LDTDRRQDAFIMPPREFSSKEHDPRAREDRWTRASDALVEELAETLERLRRTHRRERWGMAVVTVGLGALLFFFGLSTSMVVALLFLLALLGLFYLRLRLRPRQQTMAEVKGKLRFLDPRCPGCGYSLRYLREYRCPECGRRVSLPSPERIDTIVDGGSVTVAQGSVESDMGYVVLLIMLVLATGLGSAFGVEIGFGAMSLPPVLFISLQAWQRRRRARSLQPSAVCETCGQVTGIDDGQCDECGAAFLAEHVYARPGLYGNFDPRLYCSWAQIAGAAAVGSMLLVIAFMLPNLGYMYTQINNGPLLLMQLILLSGGLYLLRFDAGLRAKDRLQIFDTSLTPLCSRCLCSLKGQPATGTCPHCGVPYRAVELAGGR
jgi:hypothetical protein